VLLRLLAELDVDIAILGEPNPTWIISINNTEQLVDAVFHGIT
jgi:hypothetical protein